MNAVTALRRRASNERLNWSQHGCPQRARHGRLTSGAGLYARQLRVWFEAFPREHFLVLLTEDLAERPDAVARQAFAFLDVDPDVELPPPSPANVGWTPRYPRLAAALNRRDGMMATLKHLVPYSSRQRVRKLINRLEPPAI